ncbi:MAG: 16S rRNA (uracil(1498)-N(3))-methyltransferase [Rickettsiales bacterium]|nr:16S rRNA (uracil(1498)-N(3))-methyltransferase [Rickettsiales bacterium]
MRKELLKRIFVNDIIEDEMFVLEDLQIISRLLNVLRLRINDEIILFNHTTKEWCAKITSIHKKQIIFETTLLPAKLENKIEVTLAFSPIKQERIRFLLEKCTEIGVVKFIPLIFDRTIVRDTNKEKLLDYIISACEQSGRVSIPEITDNLNIAQFLSQYQKTRIIFCNEKESDFLINKVIIKEDTIIVVGPEGGVTDQERSLFESAQNVVSVSLGKNILRAETAAIFSVGYFAALQI